MKTERSAFKTCEEAGQAAAGKGLGKEVNPYTKAAHGNSGHLLDQESRQQLADAWLKGWERSQRGRSAGP